MKKLIRKILLFGLALFLPGAALAQPYFNLQKIPGPQLKSPRIIKATANDDFWVLDQRGILLRFNHSRWMRFPIPQNKRLTGFSAVAIDAHTFLASGFDENWHTKLFWFRNGRWEEDTLQPENPVKQIFVDGSGKIYIAGDWATFYRYEKEQWHKIKLPFTASFLLFAFSGEEMYMSTSGQGLFKFDGKKAVKLPIELPGTLQIVKVQKDSTGTLFFSTFNGQVFRWDGRIFRRTDQSPPDSVTYSFQYIRWRNVKMPNLSRLRQIVPLKQGALIVSADGSIYKLIASTHSFFMDFTQKYHLNLFKDIFVRGAFFFYWNDDPYPDLYLMSNSQYSDWKFYVNQPERPFDDVSHQVKFRKRDGDYLSLPADLNNDGRTDLAVMQLAKDGNRLKYFLQDRDHRFRLFGQIPFTNLNAALRNFKSLYTGDFDGNGLADLGVSTYFDRRLKRGTQILTFNHRQAMNFETVSLPGDARHYTAHTVWADFNNDGENDLLLINQWAPMNILFHDGVTNRFVSQTLPTKSQDAPAGAVVFDYDNDGDADILYSSAFYTLRLLTNRGGQFDSTFQPAGFSVLNREKYPFPVSRFMTVLDVNNDGYEDIFFSLKDPKAPRNYLFINQSGQDFKEEAAAYGVDQPALLAAICADVDRDGDMDLFGYNAKRNVLWINNLDRKNFLEITVEGVRSNRSGLGCRLWVYRAGHLNDPKYLIAYRQLPNASFRANLANQSVFHVGVADSGLYDLRLHFYHGRTRILRNVAPGSFLTVKETGVLAAEFYRIPAVVLRFFAWPENRIYVLLTLVMGFLLYYTIRLGMRRFGWKNTGSLIIALYIITIYWITLMATADSGNWVYQFLMPPGAVIVNLIFIFAYSLFSQPMKFGHKNAEQIEEELLKNLLVFNHGEAGSKNLVSLQLLLNNPPESEQKRTEYKQLLDKRLQIFREYNFPVLKRIQSLLQELKPNDDHVKELQDRLVFFERECCESLERMREEINKLYSLIRRLKEEFFRKFSCDPESVVLQLVDVLPKELNVSVYKNYQGKHSVFIKCEDLYFILDNLLQNARKAIRNLTDGYIRITLIKETPGMTIKVHNNGPDIPHEKKERLFKGESKGKKGQGMGLPYSRRILEKYQGKIRLEPREHGETVFSIELKEMI